MKFTRFLYFIPIAIATLLSAFFMAKDDWTFSSKFWSIFPCFDLDKLPADSTPVWALMIRISFAISIYHGILFLLTIGANSDMGSTVSKAIHRKGFFWKTSILIGLFVLSLFIGNDFMSSYAYVGFTMGGIFLMFQVVLLLQLGYVLFQNAIGEDAEVISRIILFIVMLAIYAAGLTCFVYCFTTTNQTLIPIIGLALVVIYVVVGATSPSGSTLPGSILTLIVGIMILGACQTLDSDSTALPKWFGNTLNVTNVLLMLISTFFLCFSAVTLSPLFEGSSLSMDDFDEYASDDDDEDLESSDTSYSYAFFHLILAFSGGYLALLFDSSAITYAAYIKVIGAYISALLFAWTMIGPAILPDRTW